MIVYHVMRPINFLQGLLWEDHGASIDDLPLLLINYNVLMILFGLDGGPSTATRHVFLLKFELELEPLVIVVQVAVLLIEHVALLKRVPPYLLLLNVLGVLDVVELETTEVLVHKEGQTEA